MLERSSEATQQAPGSSTVVGGVSLVMVDSEVTLLIFWRLGSGSSDCDANLIDLRTGGVAIPSRGCYVG